MNHNSNYSSQNVKYFLRSEKKVGLPQISSAQIRSAQISSQLTTTGWVLSFTTLNMVFRPFYALQLIFYYILNKNKCTERKWWFYKHAIKFFVKNWHKVGKYFNTACFLGKIASSGNAYLKVKNWSILNNKYRKMVQNILSTC